MRTYLKSKDITRHPIVMYRCENWTINKAECRKINAFKLWCWRRLLRTPWTPSRSNQSILMEINPEYSLRGLVLKLKLQSFSQLLCRMTHWKRPWCWERLRAGGEGDDRGWDGWMDMSLSKLQEMVKIRGACCAAVHGVVKSRIWLSDWTTITLYARHWIANYCVPDSVLCCIYELY